MKVRFHQAAAESLVRDFRLPAQEDVGIDHVRSAGGLAGYAQMLIVFINALVQRVRQAESVAAIQLTGEPGIELRLDQVIDAKQMQ